VSADRLPRLPLVGRADSVARLRAALEGAAAGRGSTTLLTGPSGIGKSRLLSVIEGEAASRGWQVAIGRAYPVESGVPYAAFADALVPLLRQIGPDAVAALSGGETDRITRILPAFPRDEETLRSTSGPRAADEKARLFWTFSQFLGRLGNRTPLLLCLEDLHWADSATVELFHFLARRMEGCPIVMIGSYVEGELDTHPTLREVVRSIRGMDAGSVQRIAELNEGEVQRLVTETFGLEAGVVEEFASSLYRWTQGNPFFVEETLKALVEEGKLYQRDGTWLGWETRALELPRSVRETISARLDRLPEVARTVAADAAVVGTSVGHTLLERLSAVPEDDLLEALDLLREAGIVVEREVEGAITYDFTHPLIREVLYAELGMARTRRLHRRVAEALESFHGDRALDHAGDLAAHFVRAGAAELQPKVARYLAAAGQAALDRHADREAVGYLRAALEGGAAEAHGSADLVRDLARAHQRLGEYDRSIPLWQKVLELGDPSPEERAAVERRIGLAHYWTGGYTEALERYETGIDLLEAPGRSPLLVRLRLAKAMCLQELGDPGAAHAEVSQALELAEDLGDPALLARVHRALLLLYLWTGPSERAREHGEEAVRLATEIGHAGIACTTHWALAMLGGLTGDSAFIQHHIDRSERLSDEARSPLLRLWTVEVRIEYLSGIGEWDAAVALGERSIVLARDFGQRTLLPRLLVWTALLHVDRGDLERGEKYIREAWDLAGASRAAAADGPMDVHVTVPVHTGMAALHLARGEYDAARDVGERGLEIADRSGYVVWAIHRLIPIITESLLWQEDLRAARKLGHRLREESERFGNRLGLAWADACDALVAHLHGEHDQALVLLTDAIHSLEAIPYVAHAARLRRQLANALCQVDRRDDAVRELRLAHDVFARLGARPELEATRAQLRDLGSRPPTRQVESGIEGLTGRESEIVHLVSRHRSNKEIGRALGISSRTVSTHLTNIFKKLGVDSRAELADRVRSATPPGA
jgi:DNA-binding CsgD family transcriptional regulator